MKDTLTPLRILIVHNCFGPLAGAEANLYITAQHLAQRHQVAILHGPPTDRDTTPWEKLFPQRYPIHSPQFKDSAAATAAAIAQFRPQLIYVHKTSDLPLLRTLVDSSIPLVRMVHDHDIYCMRGYRYHPLTRQNCTRPHGPACIFPCLAHITRSAPGSTLPIQLTSYTDKKREIALAKRFHSTLVVTHFMRRELELNGFDSTRIHLFPPVPRPATPIQPTFSQRNLILYAGQIIRGKGVDHLIRALALLPQDLPWETIILGDGSHKPTCEKLVRKLGLQHRITFQGFVPQEQLTTYYREATLVAIPSLWPEPIATIGLEVMRHALPIVAYDAGGISDWLEDQHNGRLIPWGDIPTYSSAIAQLLQDKSLARRMGQAGLQLVNERYDYHRYIQDLETHLHHTAALAA